MPPPAHATPTSTTCEGAAPRNQRAASGGTSPDRADTERGNTHFHGDHMKNAKPKKKIESVELFTTFQTIHPDIGIGVVPLATS